MKLKDCNTTGKKYVHLSERDRYKIEGFLESKMEVEEIAKILGRDRSTIYSEKKRGRVQRTGYDLVERQVYRVNVAQADYEKQGRNKERRLKIGKDNDLERHIRIKLKARFSPD